MSGPPAALVNHPARVSFTVRRPSPLSSRQSSAGPEANPPTPSKFLVPAAPPPQPNSREDTGSDDDDSSAEEETDELVTGFDSMGVQRVKPVKKPTGPLVIAPLANRDWRQYARVRQAAKGYIPDSGRAAVMVGADGSQGGLGTRDTINSGPQLSGLIVKPKMEPDDQPSVPLAAEDDTDGDTTMKVEEKELDADALALRALVNEANGINDEKKPELAAIPITEEAAFQRDMANLPDVASLDDYARVPVDQFGAAMLRGMGWKPPAPGKEELWLPAQRPSLLGLGAKPKPADVADPKKAMMLSRKNGKHADRKYIPLVKVERNGGEASGRSSRASSRSRSPPSRREPSRRERDDDRDRDRRRERDDYHDRHRDSDRENDRHRDSRSWRDDEGRRDRDKEPRRDKDRSEKDRPRSDRDSDRERASHRERVRDRDHYDSRRR